MLPALSTNVDAPIGAAAAQPEPEAEHWLSRCRALVRLLGKIEKEPSPQVPV